MITDALIVQRIAGQKVWENANIELMNNRLGWLTSSNQIW